MSSPLKKRTLREWWEDFCDSVSRGWDSFRLKFRAVDRPLVGMEELDNSFTTNPFDNSEDEGVTSDHKVRTSTARPELCTPETAPQPTSAPGLISINEQQTHHSSLTVAAAQQSEKDLDDKVPAHMFRVGIAFLAIAGALAGTGAVTQIYGLFALAGLMAIIGTALCITAYALNNQEKNGTLFSQVFPEKFTPTPVMGIYG